MMTEEGKQLSHLEWYNERDHLERVKRYFPGISLLPKGRKMIPTTCTGVNLVVVGFRGCGKSAFIESCEHAIKGLPIDMFHRQSNSSDSNTRGSEMVEITDTITMFDTEGENYLGTNPTNKKIDELLSCNDLGFLAKIIGFFSNQNVTEVPFHCPIFCIDGSSSIGHFEAIIKLVKKYKEITKKHPVVVVTNIKSKNYTKDKKDYMNEECESHHEVENYLLPSKKQKDDDPSPKSEFAKILCIAGKISDELIRDKLQGTIRFVPAKK